MGQYAIICGVLLALVVLIQGQGNYVKYGTINWEKGYDSRYGGARVINFYLNLQLSHSYNGFEGNVSNPQVGDVVFLRDYLFYYGARNNQASRVPFFVVGNTQDALTIFWSGSYTYPSVGSYQAYLGRCNFEPSFSSATQCEFEINPFDQLRIGTTIQITQDEVAGFALGNNSPFAYNFPSFTVTSFPFVYNLLADDAEADAVSFRLATALEAGSVIQPPGITVDADGTVTLNTQIPDGTWSTQQIIADSFGNEVALQYTFDVYAPIVTTGNPTTANPTTADPTTGNPTTANPTTGNPTTANPTTGNPTTANPTTGNPTTANPTTGNPTTGAFTTGAATTGAATTGLGYNVPTDTCLFKFKNGAYPTFTMPAAQPNSPGDVTLNNGNPIMFSNAEAQGCNSQRTEYWNGSQWTQSWVNVNGQTQSSISNFYATSNQLKVRTIQTNQANLRNVLAGKAIRTYMTCNNNVNSCVQYTVA